MNLRQKQSLFADLMGEFLNWISNCTTYKITFGDFWARSGHVKGSFHYRRLAADLNLFINGKYQTTTKAHEKLGTYWKSLHPMCTWGGDFKRKDGNHYSFGEHPRWPKR